MVRTIATVRGASRLAIGFGISALITPRMVNIQLIRQEVPILTGALAPVPCFALARGR